MPAATAVFNRISANNLRGDLFGGLTAAVIALPMALAFGVASGAGATAGSLGCCAGWSLCGPLWRHAHADFRAHGPDDGGVHFGDHQFHRHR